MKIYTKTGDEGCTFMPSVGKVDKYHCSVDAQGEIDELNAWLGHVLCKYPKLTFLEDAQVVLMQIGAQLALSKQMVLEINIKKVEDQINEIEAKLPELTNFIIPGFPSEIHIARTVCRRAERQISLWKSKTADEDKFKFIIPYLNRLSDYLFVCARSIAESDEIWNGKSSNNWS